MNEYRVAIVSTVHMEANFCHWNDYSRLTLFFPVVRGRDNWEMGYVDIVVLLSSTEILANMPWTACNQSL
jgi:hypothetical protein